MDTIPTEIFITIFKYIVTYHDIKNWTIVCKKWHVLWRSGLLDLYIDDVTVLRLYGHACDKGDDKTIMRYAKKMSRDKFLSYIYITCCNGTHTSLESLLLYNESFKLANLDTCLKKVLCSKEFTLEKLCKILTYLPIDEKLILYHLQEAIKQQQTNLVLELLKHVSTFRPQVHKLLTCANMQDIAIRYTFDHPDEALKWCNNVIRKNECIEKKEDSTMSKRRRIDL